MNIKKTILKTTIIFILIHMNYLFASVVQPSEVYAEAMKINKELTIIQQALKIKNPTTTQEHIKLFNTNLKPRHVWQKTYLVLVKINVLRKNHNLPRVEEVAVEPVLNLAPDLVYGMTQRILTELRIFKRLKNITTKITPTKTYKDKKPIDVFNLMHKNSLKLDKINKNQIKPSDVYAQVMRLHEDISQIFKYLSITDTTVPPLKNINSKPKDAYIAVLKLIDTIQKIQLKMGLTITNFDTFRNNNIQPSDVINMVMMAISEIQPIKSYIGLKTQVTPPAKSYQHKVPADVEQLLYWNVKRIVIINESKLKNK